METGFFASARRWATALGLAAAATLPTVTGAAVAAPFVPLDGASVPATENGVIEVRDHGWRRGGWDRGWNRDRYWRHRHHDRGAGLALGLGIGLPLAAYLATRPSYDYGPYNGYYSDRYVVRRVAPRPVYRSYYAGNSHVGWCYSRYRSYRAYDNTFKPYYGPRRQCYSPYN